MQGAGPNKLFRACFIGVDIISDISMLYCVDLSDGNDLGDLFNFNHTTPYVAGQLKQNTSWDRVHRDKSCNDWIQFKNQEKVDSIHKN